MTSLYFDQDGYDFKNGTSQATPMVSGSAALLKLYLGDISIKELKARLFASAQRSGDPLLSLYGEINLSQALAFKPDQFLYLNTKELNTVAVNYPSGNFSFNLELDKLLPGSVDQAQLQVSFSDPNLSLSQNSFTTAITADQDSVSIPVTGTVTNLSTNSTQVLSIDLTYGSSHYSFKKELVFALDSNAVSLKSSFPDNTDLSTLRSVNDPYTLSSNPVFYTQTGQNGYSFQFYYRANGKLNPLMNMAKNSGIQLVNSAFVGSAQMLLEFYDQPNKKLIYEFWNLAQAKLTKSIDMVPDTVLFDPTQGVLLNGDHVMAASLQNGKIPPSEQDASVWVQKDTSTGDHLYFFEEKNGSLVTELLDNSDFLNQIRSQYSLAYNDPVTPLAMLTNTPGQSINTLFAIGSGYSRKVISVNFTGYKQYTIQNEYEVPAGGALQKIPFLNQMIIAVQERTNAYQVFDVTAGIFTEYVWNGALNDNLSAPIASLDSNHILAQTQKNYVVLGDGQFSNIALKRFSFLPGSLFSENFMPVTVTTQKGPMNALFIDQTLISEKHLGVLMWNGQDIIGNNFTQYIQQNGSVYFTGLTQNADGSFTCTTTGCLKFITDNQQSTFSSNLTFENGEGSTKDLDKAHALIESMQAEAIAQNIAANFGLSYDRSIQIAKMAQSWNKLSKTRALTDADADGVIQQLTGVSGEAMKDAETAMLQNGNHAPLDAILESAAQINGTTSENMSAIMNQLFVSDQCLLYQSGETTGSQQGEATGYLSGLSAGYASQGQSANYSKGTTDGYNKGYADGSAAAQTSAYNSGYSAGQTAGNSSGTTAGYNAGKSASYTPGYNAGYANGQSTNNTTLGYNAGYTQGQNNGQSAGYSAGYSAGDNTTAYNSGYNTGYNGSYNTGYSNGQTDGYNQGYADGNNDKTSYNDGYNSGYNDGYYDATGLTSSELASSMKDLDKAQALVQGFNLQNTAGLIAAQFGLSQDRAVEIAKMATAFNQLSQTRSITDADADAFTKQVVGVSIQDMKDAESAMMQFGNQAPLNTVLDTAAQTNGTTSENMRAIMNQLFIFN
ncbi:unnamed protein product [Sphagnum jensenii]